VLLQPLVPDNLPSLVGRAGIGAAGNGQDRRSIRPLTRAIPMLVAVPEPVDGSGLVLVAAGIALPVLSLVSKFQAVNGAATAVSVAGLLEVEPSELVKTASYSYPSARVLGTMKL